MKLIKNITVLLIGVIFLFTSSGYVMYKSNCSCTGEEYASVFVRPQTCDDGIHRHHRHNEANQEEACCAEKCHECVAHDEACGCDQPELFFFKLEDKAINEEAKFLLTAPVEMNVHLTEVFELLSFEDQAIDEDTNFGDPPPLIQNSLDFLIRIQQLKIPSLS